MCVSDDMVTVESLLTQCNSSQDRCGKELSSMGMTG